jgi:ATP-dependent Clp endopeptidase proteolytic subunit ClpP
VGITITEKDEESLEYNDIFYINGDIDEVLADDFIRFLIEREIRQKKPEFVKVIISSDGGYIDNCMAMIDTMKAVSFPIHIYALGHIYSCGLILFMCGTQGNRYIFKNTMAMSHQWSGGTEGKKHEIEASDKAHKMNTNKITKIYMDATGLSKEVIDKELLPASDVYLTPQDVIKWKLGDKIVTKFQ